MLTKSDELNNLLITTARELASMLLPMYNEDDKYSHWTAYITLQGQCKPNGEIVITYTVDDSGYNVSTRGDDLYDVTTEFMRRKGFNARHEPRKITALPKPTPPIDGEFVEVPDNAYVKPSDDIPF